MTTKNISNMVFCLLFLVVVMHHQSVAFHTLPVQTVGMSNSFVYTRHHMTMASSYPTDVIVETPSFNARKITASIVVNSPIDDVWNIITDYNRLAERVPNLVKSYVVPSDPYTSSNGNIYNDRLGRSKSNVRIFQEGAQKIIGFDFRASLTMDMKEEDYRDARTTAGGDVQERRLYFKLVDGQSRMFSGFDGNWHVRAQSHTKEFDPLTNDYKYCHKSILTYSVLVKPKGPVPVIALEWRIKEDVPINLMAVKEAAESMTASKAVMRPSNAFNTPTLNSDANNYNYNGPVVLASSSSTSRTSASPSLAAKSSTRITGGALPPAPVAAVAYTTTYPTTTTQWEADETLGLYMAIENKPVSGNTKSNDRVNGRVNSLRPQLRARLKQFQNRGEDVNKMTTNIGKENDYDGVTGENTNTVVQEIGILLSARGRQIAATLSQWLPPTVPVPPFAQSNNNNNNRMENTIEGNTPTTSDNNNGRGGGSVSSSSNRNNGVRRSAIGGGGGGGAYRSGSVKLR